MPYGIDTESIQNRFRDKVIAIDPPLVGGRATEEVFHRLRALAKEAIVESEQAGDCPTGFVRAHLEIEDHGRELTIHFIRDVRNYPYTAEEYEHDFGEPPRFDDLERVNCRHAGGCLHRGCGLCRCGERMWRCEKCFGEAARPN